MTSTQRLIAEYVTLHPGSTPTEIAAGAFLSVGAVQQNLRKMHKNKQLDRAIRGRSFAYSAPGVIVCPSCGRDVNRDMAALTSRIIELEQEISKLKQIELRATLAANILNGAEL